MIHMTLEMEMKSVKLDDLRHFIEVATERKIAGSADVYIAPRNSRYFLKVDDFINNTPQDSV